MNLGIDIHDHYAQVAVVVYDGNLQDEIRPPIDRLDELVEEYAGGDAAIEASGNYRPVSLYVRSTGKDAGSIVTIHTAGSMIGLA